MANAAHWFCCASPHSSVAERHTFGGMGTLCARTTACTDAEKGGTQPWTCMTASAARMRPMAVAVFKPSIAPFAATDRQHVRSMVVATALALAACGSVYLTALVNWRHAALFVVGLAAGVVLYHAAFGFTSAWRVLVSDRRGAGVRAQMLMLATACAVFIPLLANSPVLGTSLRGSFAPLGVAGLVGAFLFGVGMQLGGSCASGTLYTSGGGNTRMLLVLAFFVVGSVLGTAHAPFWDAAPSIGAVSLSEKLGSVGSARRKPGPLRTRCADHGWCRTRSTRSRRLLDEFCRASFVVVRSVAAGVGRNRDGCRQPLNADARGAAVGDHIGLCALGGEAGAFLGNEYRGMALLGRAGSRAGARRTGPDGRHDGDGPGHHARRAGCFRTGGQVSAASEGVAAIGVCRHRWWPAPGLWRETRVWLQHRRILQRRCFRQPARLGVVRCRFPRVRGRHKTSSVLRPDGRATATLMLIRPRRAPAVSCRPRQKERPCTNDHRWYRHRDARALRREAAIGE